jgi:hypothetical protein
MGAKRSKPPVAEATPAAKKQTAKKKLAKKNAAKGAKGLGAGGKLGVPFMSGAAKRRVSATSL